jgi:succinate dehydrogenase hydrophobic anchor subunit
LFLGALLIRQVKNGTFFHHGRLLAERITAMALILLSMTMFFVMLFATANAIRKEARMDRSGPNNSHLFN